MEKKILEKLKQIVIHLPHAPGVYQLKNKEGNSLYVGKAKDLKNRVSQYFQKGYQHSSRTRKLLDHIEGLEYLQTDSELEAYILETNLIKELRPRYNIVMKDDKNFLYLKISMNEDFPRIRIVRRVEKDGAKYIGPKTNSTQIYETFRVLKKILPFRHCQLDITWKENDSEKVEVKNRVIDYPCLDYFIKRCPGPCIGAISPSEYKKIVQEIVDFLEGKGEHVIKKLKNDMTIAAAEKKFEQAARIRDKLFAVESMLIRQKVSDPERRDTDVIHFVIEMGKAFFCLFRIREGKLIDRENFILDALELEKNEREESEILESFLQQYYEKVGNYPKEILLPLEIENGALFQKWLSNKKGTKAKILIPQRGEKNQLLELCRKNAEQYAKQCRIIWMTEKAEEGALRDLSAALEIKIPKGKILRRIECYDISHTGGQETVGSMVVFENGYPKRDHYRHFTLRTVQGKPDDFSSMKEILSRRLKYLDTKVDPEISFRSATKKDLDFIRKNLEEQNRPTDDLQTKDCIVAKKKKTIIGYGRLHALSQKIITLSGLWVAKEYRGQKLGYEIMKRLIVRTKAKRIYIDCTKNLENYYAIFGFTLLKQAPEELVHKVAAMLQYLKSKKLPTPWEHEVIYMVYDKIKHKLDPAYNIKPNLILVDGGKPQLSAALEALKQYQLDIPIIALAKRLEEVYIPEKEAPFLFEEGEEALKLLQRIRDEAHRFAITFGRELHRKAMLNH